MENTNFYPPYQYSTPPPPHLIMAENPQLNQMLEQFTQRITQQITLLAQTFINQLQQDNGLQVHDEQTGTIADYVLAVPTKPVEETTDEASEESSDPNETSSNLLGKTTLQVIDAGPEIVKTVVSMPIAIDSIGLPSESHDISKFLPEIPASQVFDENPKRVIVQEAPLLIPQGMNPIICSPNPFWKALKIRCDRVMVYKRHENEYGKFNSKFYDNFKITFNATQVFDEGSERLFVVKAPVPTTYAINSMRTPAVLNERALKTNSAYKLTKNDNVVYKLHENEHRKVSEKMFKVGLDEDFFVAISPIEFYSCFKYTKDVASERRSQQVYVAEPSVPDTIYILRGLKERYEGNHGVRIQDRALLVAAQLSSRYIAGRHLHDKAIDLVDEVCANVRLQLDSQPGEMDNLERKRMQLEIELHALEKEKSKASKARFAERFETCMEIVDSLSTIEKGWELNMLTATASTPLIGGPYSRFSLLGILVSLDGFFSPCEFNNFLESKSQYVLRCCNSLVQSEMMLWPFNVLYRPGDKPIIAADYKGEEEKTIVKEVSSIVFTNTRGIVEALPCKAVKNVVVTVLAYFKGSQSQATKKGVEENVFIFDPGGYVPACVIHFFKEMIKNKDVKLDKVTMVSVISTSGHLGELKELIKSSLSLRGVKIQAPEQAALKGNYGIQIRNQKLGVVVVDSCFFNMLWNTKKAEMKEIDVYIFLNGGSNSSVVTENNIYLDTEVDDLYWTLGCVKIQVLKVEVNQIINVCNSQDKKWRMKILFIIAPKKLLTKFYHPTSSDKEFYLCALVGLIGATRLTLYHDLLDEGYIPTYEYQDVVHLPSYVYLICFSVMLVVALIIYAYWTTTLMGMFMKFDDLLETSSNHVGLTMFKFASVPQLLCCKRSYDKKKRCCTECSNSSYMKAFCKVSFNPILEDKDALKKGQLLRSMLNWARD